MTLRAGGRVHSCTWEIDIYMVSVSPSEGDKDLKMWKHTEWGKRANPTDKGKLKEESEGPQEDRRES